MSEKPDTKGQEGAKAMPAPPPPRQGGKQGGERGQVGRRKAVGTPHPEYPRHREGIPPKTPAPPLLPPELLLRISLMDAPTWEGLPPTRLPGVPNPEPQHTPRCPHSLTPHLHHPHTAGAPGGQCFSRSPLSPQHLRVPQVPLLWLGTSMPLFESSVHPLCPGHRWGLLPHQHIWARFCRD